MFNKMDLIFSTLSSLFVYTVLTTFQRAWVDVGSYFPINGDTMHRMTMAEALWYNITPGLTVGLIVLVFLVSLYLGVKWLKQNIIEYKEEVSAEGE